VNLGYKFIILLYNCFYLNIYFNLFSFYFRASWATKNYLWGRMQPAGRQFDTAALHHNKLATIGVTILACRIGGSHNGGYKEFYLLGYKIKLNLCGGTLCTAATTSLLYQPRMMGDGGKKIGRGNRSTRRKPAPAPLCPPQIPHDFLGYKAV
jgi:hypothetical protein